MTTTIQMRVKPERKKALQDIAKIFHEDLSTFLMKAAFLRAELGVTPEMETDPFVTALKDLTKNSKPHELSVEDLAAIKEARVRRMSGKADIQPVSHLRQQLRSVAPEAFGQGK
jgi:hypothetical protein